MNITIVSGSHRESSQSEKVARYITKALSACHVESEVITLAKNPLPLWDEGVWGEDARWQRSWSPIAETLTKSSGIVLVSPEWGGMVPPGLKNFLLLCSSREVGHKPALIVSVSSGIGGSYPVTELRASSYKNNRIVYVPDHVIVRDVGAVLTEDEPTGERDISIRERIQYSLNMLIEYAQALAQVRESGVINYKDFPYGM